MRIYEVDEEKFISVTTIIGLMNPFDKKSYHAWCKMSKNDPEFIKEESIRIGNYVSELAENRFLGIEEYVDFLPILDKDLKYLEGVNRFCKEWDILDSEKFVLNHDLKYGGKADAIASPKGDSEKWYIDFKTFGAWRNKEDHNPGKIKKANTQISMYHLADSPEDTSHKQAVIIFDPDGSYFVSEQEYDDSFIGWIGENQNLIQKTIKYYEGQLQKEKGTKGS